MLYRIRSVILGDVCSTVLRFPLVLSRARGDAIHEASFKLFYIDKFGPPRARFQGNNPQEYNTTRQWWNKQRIHTIPDQVRSGVD